MKKLIVLFSLLMCLVFSPFALATDPDPLLVADLDQIEAESKAANEGIATRFQSFTDNYLGTSLDASAWQENKEVNTNTSSAPSARQAVSARNETFVLDLFTGSGETVDTTIDFSREEAVEANEEDFLDDTINSADQPKQKNKNKKENVLVCPTKESLLRWQADGIALFDDPEFPPVEPARRNIRCLQELSKEVKSGITMYKSDYYPGPPRKQMSDFCVPHTMKIDGKVFSDPCGKSKAKGCGRASGKKLAICIHQKEETSNLECYHYERGICSTYIKGFWNAFLNIKEMTYWYKKLGFWNRYDRVEFTREPSSEENARYVKALRAYRAEHRATAAWNKKHGIKTDNFFPALVAARDRDLQKLYARWLGGN